MLQHLWTILLQSFFNPETQSTLKQEVLWLMASAFVLSPLPNCRISTSHGSTACWLRPCVCKGSATWWPVQHTYSHQALTKSWQKKTPLKCVSCPGSTRCLVPSYHVSSWVEASYWWWSMPWQLQKNKLTMISGASSCSCKRMSWNNLHIN